MMDKVVLVIVLFLVLSVVRRDRENEKD